MKLQFVLIRIKKKMPDHHLFRMTKEPHLKIFKSSQVKKSLLSILGASDPLTDCKAYSNLPSYLLAQ